MRVLAVVQARMGSRRLPGKSLAPLWGEVPLVELVLRRTQAARAVDEVVLATSSASEDDALATWAEGLGCSVVRGGPDDVLGRFRLALERHPADAVVRVCADNPFVDPQAIDALVACFAGTPACDYAANHTPSSGLPDGIGAEVLTAAALVHAAAHARDPAEREHVTLHLTARPQRFRLRHVPPPAPPLPRVRLDVDTPADLRHMRALARALPAAEAPLWTCHELLAAHAAVAAVPA